VISLTVQHLARFQLTPCPSAIAELVVEQVEEEDQGGTG